MVRKDVMFFPDCPNGGDHKYIVGLAANDMRSDSHATSVEVHCNYCWQVIAVRLEKPDHLIAALLSNEYNGSILSWESIPFKK